MIDPRNIRRHSRARAITRYWVVLTAQTLGAVALALFIALLVGFATSN